MENNGPVGGECDENSTDEESPEMETLSDDWTLDVVYEDGENDCFAHDEEGH